MKSSPRKPLTSPEWVVANAIRKLCRNQPNVTVGEVMQSLKKKKSWNVSTLKTTMERMVGKGVLSSTLRGRTCFYELCVPWGDIARRDIAERLDAILDGTFGPLVAYLSDKASLTKEQIAELEDLLESGEKE